MSTSHCVVYSLCLELPPNFPTGIHKVSSYLFMTVCVAAFSHADEALISTIRSEAVGNPQVSSYTNRPAPFLPTPTFPITSSEKHWKAGATGLAFFLIACLSSFFLFPPSSPPPLPPLFSLRGNSEDRYEHVNTRRRKRKALKPANAPVFFLFSASRVYRNWHNV